MAKAAEAIRRDLSNVEGLVAHEVDVSGHGNKVQVRLRLQPDPTTDPSVIASHVSSRVRESVKRLGLETDFIRLTMVPRSAADTFEPRPAKHAA